MPSPTRDAIPSCFSPSPLGIDLQTPLTPRTQRTLRKLQSAHNLGAANKIATSSSTTLTQQTLRHVHSRDISPTRRQALNRSPQRHRANSDASGSGNPPNLRIASSSASLHAKRNVLNRTPSAADGLSLDRLIRDGPPDDDVGGALINMRFKVLDQGIKSDIDGMSSSRIYIWLILLDAPVLTTGDYLKLVHRGASPAYSKIRNDTFRTLTTDPLFRRRVSEASLIRLLNAVAWMLHDSKEVRRPASSRQSLPPSNSASPARSDMSQINATSPAARSRARALTLTTEGSDSNASEPGTYVQGMNVLAAPFLYAARSEAEAFVAFHQLLTRECPAYIRGAMDGVHRGLALVDKVLGIVDTKLSLYLTSKGLSAEIYAFPSVLTLCACTPPLPEVLRLWDFLFAYGPHLNILCIVAQLIMMRNELLSSSSPNKLLRSFPTLHADQIKAHALAIVKMIPSDVYEEIVNHAL
ncbi:rab-GTPase-TBC domain-containing protein [Xylaria bambusicola]|uniref:rab-GTPase-TBC domain-containing protein n=1 Tax=Xylaria bambusicola TaxID=326684 RepID=UPI00200879B0|nr:rab-GTPase-TBC domain-containing protein [Xylaria bambusicola]KAI0512454.1 rab-GTPase-TBC domain-containing protein [Xylaria bambusicola]